MSESRVLMTADAVGGVFTYAVTLARELARRNTAVHLATMGPPLRPAQRAAACDVPGLVLHESTYALEWMEDPWDDVAAAGDWLLELSRRIRPHVVHLNGFCHATVGFDAPVVVAAHSCVLSWWESVHGEAAPARYATYRQNVTRGLAAADGVITPSHAMRRALERLYGAVEVTVVPNGVPRRGRRTAKEPFVLSCGRVWDRAKNVDALAAVAPRLSWPVIVAGSGGGLRGVQDLGWLSADALAELMARAALFVLPGRYEPFGLSALEAAHAGCALVLGDIESQREVWGDAALFVDPDDHEALASRIEHLVSDPEHRARCAMRAMDRARTYTPERMADATLALYARALGGVRCAS